MEKENKKIEKLCSFYVSDWHLATMILPYINNKIDENVKIVTILENDIEKNMKILVEKLNLRNKKEILKINWSNLESKKYADLEKRLKQETKEKSELVILVNGTKDYMEKNNSNIEKWLAKSFVSSAKIINFFEVTEFNNNIVEILEKHDKVFNTSGEKEINEVFEGYKKGEKVETKKVVGDTIEE